MDLRALLRKPSPDDRERRLREIASLGSKELDELMEIAGNLKVEPPRWVGKDHVIMTTTGGYYCLPPNREGER